MKNKKAMSKILISIIVLVIVNFISMQNVFAKGLDSIEDVTNAGSKWIEVGKNTEKETGLTVDYFADLFIGIGKVLVAVAIIVIVIVTAVTAFNWIIAPPDKQAKLKQQLIGLVISIVVIFGAVGIWNFVRGMMQDVEDDIAFNNSNSKVYVATME